MIRTALIGASGYAGLYLQNLIRLQNDGVLVLEAVVVKDAATHQQEIAQLNSIGIRVLDTTAQLFAEFKGKLDLCCIPTSIGSHAMLTLGALEIGSNVLVEKPAAATVLQIEQMQEAAQKANREVFVGFQNIYSDDAHAIKRLVLDGAIGQPQTIKMLGMWPRAKEYFSRNQWAGKLILKGEPVLDSVAHNAFAHFLNLMCFWSGKTQHTSAKITTVQAELYRVQPIQTFDTCSVRMETENGSALLFGVTHSCKESFEPEIIIEGDKGTIKWNGASYWLNEKETRLAETPAQSIVDSRVTMFNRVVQKLQGQEVPVCNLEIAKSTTTCINAMHSLGTIHDVDNAYLEVSPTQHGSQIAIQDVEEYMKAAYHRGVLLSETGAPWAQKTTVKGLSGFKSFDLPEVVE